MLRKFLLIAFSSLLVSCNMPSRSDNSTSTNESDYPKPWNEKQLDQMGKLTGENGIVLFGGKSKSSPATEGINVNSYLWKATLDTIYKVPILSADPFSGVIITDWYRPNDNAKDRFKINIFIIGTELRSDALRVAAFKQTLDNHGQWRDANTSDTIATEIENRILLKARAIKFKSR